MHANAAVNVDEFIDNAPLRGAHWRVVLLCGFVAMLDGFDAQSIAFVTPLLAQQWSLDATLFAPVFSAGLVGIMIGQLIFGALSDRLGRRAIVIFCTIWFGLFTLATVRADSLDTLLALRLITGVGLGGAMPNIISLTSELAPRRHRATLITLMFGGFPLGAAVGGALSGQLIPAFGWEAVFYLGGGVPLLLAPLLIWLLPESIHHLVARKASGDRIARALGAFLPHTDAPATGAVFILREKVSHQFSFVRLFTEGRSITTLHLWTAYFLSLLMIYFLMSWLPTVMRQSGLSISAAINMAVFLNLGGMIGGVALGALADRLNPYAVLALGYALAGVSIALIGLPEAAEITRLSAVFAAGFFVIGGQTALHTVAAPVYPAQARATGLGAALAAGRVGSIIGPMAGGALLAAGHGFTTLFAIAAAPSIAACAIIASLGLLRRKRAPGA